MHGIWKVLQYFNGVLYVLKKLVLHLQKQP